MENNKTKKKEFFLWRWLKRAFFGFDREFKTDERFDSPGKLAAKRFFRKPVAVISLIIIVCLFIFVFVGSAFAPVDLSNMETLHANIAPCSNMMSIPKEMIKNGVKSISSRSSFTLGLDNKGKLYIWGNYDHTGSNPATNCMLIPEETNNEEILFATAGKDHCIAIGKSGKVYAWGEYDNGQYGDKGTLIAMCRKEPDILVNGELDPTQVRQLVSGVQVTAILMNDGTLYLWGNDQVSATNGASIVKKIKKEDIHLAKVVFTNTGLFGITEDGQFITGKSKKFDNYEQYKADGTATAPVPLADYINGRKIVDIASSGDALILLAEDGEMIAPGLTVPLPEIAENEKVISVSGGTRHFTVLTDKGTVYSFGGNRLGQTKVPENMKTPGAADRVIASGFQNYAFKDGEKVAAWGLKGYMFGTDEMGRDVFNRVMNGGQMTMTIGAVSVIISSIIALIIGCLMGYFGGKVDMLLMRVTEIFGAIPFLPFALVLSAILQSSDLHENTRIFIFMVILGVLSWTGLARMIRAKIFALREEEFVTAARSVGVRESVIAFKHVLPNVASIILVDLTLGFAGCMLTESSLSYLGFGVQLPRPTWGNMLFGCNNEIVIQNYWWRWVFPAIFLSIAVICINTIGDALRDALDPKSEVGK